MYTFLHFYHRVYRARALLLPSYITYNRIVESRGKKEGKKEGRETLKLKLSY